MSRVLITWELGLNLGHLARLLPVARQLVSEGHSVLVATREIQAAAAVLGPAGIPFVQAPHLPRGIALAHRPAGYADILLSQGWSHVPSLQGLTHAWLNLFRLYNPDRLLLDYSPTVSLAARIAKIPTVLVGNGFELPPARDPLPPFSGFSWATAAQAAVSEALSIANANRVLTHFGAPKIAALRDLFIAGTRLLATLPVLDHYGERTDEQYVGPLLGRLQAATVDWPAAMGPKIFACLRADTRDVRLILGGLTAMKASVLCIVSGMDSAQLEEFRRDHIRFVSAPVNLESLQDAQLCVTYGAEGTMLRFLLAGVPQLIAPWHVEAYMAARRIAAAGLGAMLPDGPDQHSVNTLIEGLSTDARIRERTEQFARQVMPLDAHRAVAEALSAGECHPSRDPGRGKPHADPERRQAQAHV